MLVLGIACTYYIYKHVKSYTYMHQQASPPPTPHRPRPPPPTPHPAPGLLYRRVGLAALDRGIPLEDEQSLARLAASLPPLQGHEERSLRTEAVAQSASKVSALPKVSSPPTWCTCPVAVLAGWSVG